MIIVDLSKCTGCRRCETACAFHHTGKVNNHQARIKVVNIYETGIDSPVVCQQCAKRYCLKCSSNALSIGSLGQIVVSMTNCDLCGACETFCPIGAIEVFNDVVYVCDLCGGNPKCVEACTEQAIRYEPNSKSPSLAKFKMESKGLNTSEKRYKYSLKLGNELRNEWRKKR